MAELLRSSAILRRLGFGRGAAPSFTRAEDRVRCDALARLVFVEQEGWLDGALLDITQRGALFRPATRMIMQRSEEHIRVVVGRFEISGEIRNTSTDGYGIRFATGITDADVRSILLLPKFNR